MSFLSKLHAIEKEVAQYAETAGKDIETVFEEIKAFIVGKKVEAQNAQAAASNPTPAAPPAEESTAAGTAANS